MTSKNIRAFVVSAIGFAALALPGLAAQPTTIDFSGETVGAEPKSLRAGRRHLADRERQWQKGARR